MGILPGLSLNVDIYEKLLNVVGENPHAQFLRRLKDFPSLDAFQVRITKHVNLDQRIYNAPTSDEVAVIWIEENNTNIPFKRDIILVSHSGQ